MSLHARIAIGSSRRAMVLERLAALGGLGLVTATAVVRFGSTGALLVGLAAVSVVVWSTARVFRSKRDVATFVLAESGRIEVHPSGSRVVEHLEIAEGSLLWPGLAVLRLVPAPFAAAAPRTVVAFDRELAGDDRRALHRYLLWVWRGGVRRDRANDRSS